MRKQSILTKSNISLLAVLLIMLWSIPLSSGQYKSSSIGMGSEEKMHTTGVLDGKIFTGKMGVKGKEASSDNDVSFNDGKFHSKVCDKYNFGEGVYKVTWEGDSKHFEAVTLSPTDGKMMWKGTIASNVINATAVWYNKDGELKQLWFKGELKK